jgi:hypothetical protein
MKRWVVLTRVPAAATAPVIELFSVLCRDDASGSVRSCQNRSVRQRVRKLEAKYAGSGVPIPSRGP